MTLWDLPFLLFLVVALWSATLWRGESRALDGLFEFFGVGGITAPAALTVLMGVGGATGLVFNLVARARFDYSALLFLDALALALALGLGAASIAVSLVKGELD